MNKFDILIHGYKFVLGCRACPEQYDVFDQSGKQVAYCRLRHSTFKVECPDVGGEMVYYTTLNIGDGIFSEKERLPKLTSAAVAIQEWILRETFKNDEV